MKYVVTARDENEIRDKSTHESLELAQIHLNKLIQAVLDKKRFRFTTLHLESIQDKTDV
jgi:hypothetical protein